MVKIKLRLWTKLCLELIRPLLPPSSIAHLLQPLQEESVQREQRRDELKVIRECVMFWDWCVHRLALL